MSGKLDYWVQMVSLRNTILEVKLSDGSRVKVNLDIGSWTIECLITSDSNVSISTKGRCLLGKLNVHTDITGASSLQGTEKRWVQLRNPHTFVS